MQPSVHHLVSLDVKGVMAWIKLYPFRVWLAFALAVVMSLVIGIIRSFGGESAPRQPVSTEATTPPNAETVTGQVTQAGLTLNHPGGASISVPAGALPAGTIVAITKGKAATLHQLGALQPDGVSWDVAASVEPPSLPVTLVLPYDPTAVPAGTRPLVTTYDELSGWWVPVKTTPVPETGNLIAELPGFSLKTWILDRTPAAGRGTETWLEYQGEALLRRRTDRPQCANRPVPSWVKPVVVNAGAGVSACVRGDGEGFAIEAAGTVGYPVTLDLDTPFARARSSALDSTVDGLVTQLPGGVLLLPTGKSTISYDPPPAPVGTVQGRVRRDGDTIVRLLVFEVAVGTSAARTTVGPAAVECGKRALAGPVQTDQRVATVLDCLAQALESQLRRGGFDVAASLWRSDGVSRLPAPLAQTIGALRWVRGLQAGNFAQLATEATGGAGVPGGPGAAARATVLASWADAPRWARPTGVTPLFDLVGTASVPGPSGQRLSARLAGRTYPDSTGAWVACADPPATLAYHLAGKFRRLTAVLGLAESAPADLAVRFQLTADNRTVADSVVDQRHTAAVNVDLSNVDSLVVSAVRTAGACPPSPLPFGVLGEGSLFP
jgi:NPCBM/NEW2 domain